MDLLQGRDLPGYCQSSDQIGYDGKLGSIDQADDCFPFQRPTIVYHKPHDPCRQLAISKLHMSWGFCADGMRFPDAGTIATFSPMNYRGDTSLPKRPSPAAAVTNTWQKKVKGGFFKMKRTVIFFGLSFIRRWFHTFKRIWRLWRRNWAIRLMR